MSQELVGNEPLVKMAPSLIVKVAYDLIGRHLNWTTGALTKWLWGRVLGHHIREAAQSWSIHSKDNL